MAGFLSKDELTAMVAGSVGTTDIADGAVATAKLADGAITTAKIGDGQVALGKLPDGVLAATAEGRAKMADGFINDAKVAADAAIAHTKLATGVVKSTVIDGGAAGDHTVAGISTSDSLVAVLKLDFTLTEGTPNTRTWAATDLTSEFSITAANTINNAGGTDTTGAILVVIYEDRSA